MLSCSFFPLFLFFLRVWQQKKKKFSECHAQDARSSLNKRTEIFIQNFLKSILWFVLSVLILREKQKKQKEKKQNKSWKRKNTN